MTNQLATVTNGRVTFGDAVARVAEALSPLGAAARIIAESTACAVTMKELDVASRRIDAETEVTLTRLDNRRADAAASLRELRRQVGRTDLTAEALRRCIRNMQQALGRRNTTPAEARLYADLIHGFSTDLLNHHSQQGDQVLSGIDLVLNGDSTPRRAAGTAPARGGGTGGARRGGSVQARSGGNKRGRNRHGSGGGDAPRHSGGVGHRAGKRGSN